MFILKNIISHVNDHILKWSLQSSDKQSVSHKLKLQISTRSFKACPQMSTCQWAPPWWSPARLPRGSRPPTSAGWRTGEPTLWGRAAGWRGAAWWLAPWASLTRGSTSARQRTWPGPGRRPAWLWVSTSRPTSSLNPRRSPWLWWAGTSSSSAGPGGTLSPGYPGAELPCQSAVSSSGQPQSSLVCSHCFVFLICLLMLLNVLPPSLPLWLDCLPAGCCQAGTSSWRTSTPARRASTSAGPRTRSAASPPRPGWQWGRGRCWLWPRRPGFRWAITHQSTTVSQSFWPVSSSLINISREERNVLVWCFSVLII